MNKHFLRLIWIVFSISLPIGPAFGSDHDDGESDLKARALNLTDVYVFREDSQSGNATDKKHLIMIMNSNPRSLARQQYHFSSNARYEFHASRVKANDDSPTTKDDIVIRLEFSQPDKDSRQNITITGILDGETHVVSGPKTTSLKDMAGGTLNASSVKVGKDNITVFAGLREDPFYFDVEQYFRLRAAAAGIGPLPPPASFPFKPASSAIDFAAGYNVNSIVLRVPIAWLQNGNIESAFDVWTTISVPKI